MSENANVGVTSRPVVAHGNVMNTGAFIYFQKVFLPCHVLIGTSCIFFVVASVALKLY